MALFDENDFVALSPVERDLLKAQLTTLVNALALIGRAVYRNELCTCDPQWSSHGPRCVWNTAQELLPDVEKHIRWLAEDGH